MATTNDIESYHQFLLGQLNGEGLLGQKAVVRAAPGVDWKNQRFAGPVDFDLWPTERPNVAESDQGGELAVFAFEKLNKIGSGELVEIEDEGNKGLCWISWHERWERLVPDNLFSGRRGRQPHFMLGTTQWILFWGRADEQRKVQIVRAEWDNAAHVAAKKSEYEIAREYGNEGSRIVANSDTAQPHWHVDRVLELGDVDAFIEHSGTELQELAHSSYAGQYLDLQRVHFAMGGWKNGAPNQRNHDAGWRIDYTEDRNELIDWNISTLRYIKNQIRYIVGY